MEKWRNYDAVILSGGRLDDEFILTSLEKIRKENGGALRLLIAADRGLSFCIRNHVKPDIAIGDFDSAGMEVLEAALAMPDLTVIRLKPEKDVSDTQAALSLASERGARSAVLFGCTGSRMDHVMANLGLLLAAGKLGMEIEIMDPNNRILLASPGMTLKKEELGSSNISFFPLGGEVSGLTLTGFQYPLRDYTLRMEDAGLTLSNRIAQESARVDFRTGSLMMMITKD